VRRYVSLLFVRGVHSACLRSQVDIATASGLRNGPERVFRTRHGR
jgi:hypothetical protein